MFLPLFQILTARFHYKMSDGKNKTKEYFEPVFA